MDTQSHFMGLDGFVWFVGVVEDREDPDKQGRVRVRCLGFHSENLESIEIKWVNFYIICSCYLSAYFLA